MDKIFTFFSILITTLGCSRTDTTKEMCRSRNNLFMASKKFALHSCVKCYEYMSNYSFKESAKLSDSTLFVIQEDYSDYKLLMEDETILNSFQNLYGIEKWQKCCKNAVDCCEEMLQNKTKSEADWCPRTWDGWLCWPDSPPGSVQEKLCPLYSFSSMKSCSEAYARKSCDEHGNWTKFNKSEWTNYTSCSAKSVVEKRLHLNLGFYSLSVIALLPAIIIFQRYRTLQCHRTILHKNLFASLLFHCCSEIIFNTVYALGELYEVSKFENNDVHCKIVLTFTKYFRLTNYMWMFCEGLYLHRQIIKVFVEETSLKIFYAIGWGFPILPVVVFAVIKSTASDKDCWALPSDYIDWILHLPCLLSLIINAGFLINIVRILITKLRSVPENEPSQFRKAVRATLVLAPLFGIHFLVTIYRQGSVCSIFEELYTYMGYLIDGLQGFIVAIIFCYMNTEVVGFIKRRWMGYFDNRGPGHPFHSVYNGSSVVSTTVLQSESAI